ncbi:MAG: exopolysaccharide biosynthesis polyprenyl glycosylphosphotransferase [Candidatus Nanopelagicales bacterium]
MAMVVQTDLGHRNRDAAAGSQARKPPRALLGWRLATLDALMLLLGAALTGSLVGFGWAGAAASALWVAIWGVTQAHRLGRLARSPWDFAPVGPTAVRTAVPLIVAGSSFPQVAPLEQTMPLVLALATGTLGSRWLAERWLKSRQREGQLVIPVLARGSAREIADLLDLLEHDSLTSYRVASAQVTSGDPGLLGVRVPLVAANADPVSEALDRRLRVVMLVGPQAEDSTYLRRLVWQLEVEGVDALMVPVVAPLAAPHVEHIGRTGLPLLAFQGRDMGAEVGLSKMVVDKVLAGLGLILLSPLLLGIALCVKLTSDGPILFRQTRVGRGGEEFTMRKFRTMFTGAEGMQKELEALNHHLGGTLFKITDDPRVTAVGHFLRRYSLDELPQLINVVIGEMSLVGPRPPLPQEVRCYGIDAHRRFRVRPGLTGLWQVSGRSNLDPSESARLDTHYVEHWSVWLDLRILLRTAKVVLTAEGAY